MSTLGRQLADNIADGIEFNTLEKCSLQINVMKIPLIVCNHLTGQAESWPCRRRTVGLLRVLLSVLETSQHPSGLRFLEGPVLVSLDRQDPSSCHIVLNLDFSHIN